MKPIYTIMEVLNKKLFRAFFLILAALGPFAAKAQKPSIGTLDKTSAAPQHTVTLKGSGFGTDASKLAVFFGATKASVNFVSDQLLEANVPAGATFDKISVSNLPSGLTEYTVPSFLLSFGGEHGFSEAKLEGQKDFAAESGLYDLCACDFDGDKKTDIATANDNSNSITLLTNTTSSPGLASINFNKIPILLNAKSLHVTCGDLNGDGRPDLVVSEGGTTGDRVFILQNTSAGTGSFTFSTQAIKLAGKKVKRIKIADLDRDGKPELVITNQSSNNVSILINQSTAAISFAATPVTLTIASAESTDGLAVDDLTGDGLADLIVTQFIGGGDKLYVLKNNCTPGNISFGSPLELPNGENVTNVRTGDLDGDSKPDIAVTQLAGQSVAVFLNQSASGNPAFSSPALIPVDASAGNNRPWGIDFGDLDGDGKIDIATASLTVKSLTILNNESTPGTLSFQRTLKPTTFINRHLNVADFDGDGKPDIAFTSIDDNNNNIPASRVSVFRNKVCMKPQVTPPGPLTICTGFSLKLLANNIPGTTYAWKKDGTTTSSGTDAFLDVSATGDYSVTATSEGGSCSFTSNTVSVAVDPGTLSGTPAPTNNGPVCIGSALLLSVNNVGATEYKWSGPNGFTSNDQNPTIPNFQLVNAGRYNLDIFKNSCLAQQVFTIVDAIAVPAFQINTGGSDVVCPPATKTLTLTPSPGTFTYQWFEKTSGIITGQTSPSLNATASGEYYVEAKYTANPSCATTQTPAVKITFAAAPVAGFSAPATACAGQEVSFTNTSTSDPAATVSYAWEFGDGNTSSDKDPKHPYLAAASSLTVKLTASYSNGACASTATKTLAVQAAPAATITNAQNKFAFCTGDSLKLEVAGSFASYNWSTLETTASVYVKEKGTYTVEVKTASGCASTASKEVTTLEAPAVTITAEPASIGEGQTAQLTATGLSTYKWSPGESLSDSTISNPVASPITTTTYTLTGKDSQGCSGQTTFELVVREGSVYGKIVPEAFFSPDNGDDIGQFWKIEKIENYPFCQVSIYDEKGIKVHEAKPYNNDWDGTFNGKKLPDGVYYFIIKCEGETNSPKTGSITLLR